jgi:hypothetical protein
MIVRLFSTNESYIGAVLLIKSARRTYAASQGYLILSWVRACRDSQTVTSLARYSSLLSIIIIQVCDAVLMNNNVLFHG